MIRNRRCMMEVISVCLFMLVVIMPSLVFAGSTVIKFAHVDPEDVFTSKKGAAARVFKDIVDVDASGSLEVQLYAAGQLGGERELIESTKLGVIQMCMVSGAISGYFKPAMVLDIPYLFSSSPVAWKVLDGPFGKEMADAILKETGMRVLAYGETGFRNFTNSKRPIKTPADMKGLKFRVMETPLYITMVKALGGAPTAIAWPEVYTALQQGVVDGQENPVATIMQAKLNEVQKYLTLDAHSYGTDFILINDGVFKKLTPDQQTIISNAAMVAGNAGRAVQQLNSTMGVSKLKEQKMEVYSPTAAERAEFKKLSQQPVIEWMKKEVPEEWITKVMKAVETAEAELAVK